jgi:hypothetical protein
MANEKEVKQLETLIESMKSASNALVTVYPTASLTLKYMSDDIKTIVADLKGRPAANEQSGKRQVFDLEQERAKLKAEGKVI